MAIRTTDAKVQEVLGADWDGCRSVRFALTAASSLVDDLVTLCSEQGVSPPSAAKLVLIETWVAAHVFTQTGDDRILTSRSTSGASGSFVVGKNQTPYLDAAQILDPTGLLADVVTNESAGAAWLGKTDPNKLTYEERN